jgi:Fe-S cluster assembly iron-binding protein IscA
LKHDLYFTNNDATLNDHKFYWQNKMMDAPSSFAIARVDDEISGDMTTDMYSVFSGSNQPAQLDGHGTVLNYGSSESIVYDVSDFSFNGTQSSFGFSMYQQDILPDLDDITYEFVDGINKLSRLTFDSNPDQTLDVIVDYSTVDQPLGIGQTMNLDPVTTFGTFADRTIGFSFGGSGFHCGRTSATANEATTVGVTALSLSGGSRSCSGTYQHFDISAIPDEATPTTIQLQVNVTSGACSGSNCNLNVHSRIFEIYDEDISALSLVDFANTVSVPTNTAVCKGGFTCVIDRITIGNFGNTAIGQIFPSIRSQTFSTPTQKVLLDFETQLESGKDFWQFIECPTVSNDGAGRGGCFGSGSIASRSNSIIWDRDSPDTFFEVTWVIFATPSEPQNVSATYSPTPDTCTVDWDIPLDDGGRPVDEYRVERSVDGGSFVLLLDTGLPTPTEHADTTIISGESYKYRVSAINLEGVGAGAETTVSCGVPSIADPPTLNNVFEDPVGDITLTWNDNFDGALAIDGYKIERSLNGGSFSVLVGSTGNDNKNFTDGTVGANVLNTYRVSTINSLGTSTPSNELGFTIVVSGGGGGGAGGGAGSPVGDPDPEEGLTQEDFDQALADALAQLQPQQLSVIENIVSNIFEFAVLDNTHEDLVLNSFLDDERLGIRWSSGQDIVVVSAVPSPSPFLITFEQLPAIKQGSGAVVSTDFLLYNLQVPRLECGGEISQNCVQKLRYEIPVTVTIVLANQTITDTGNITVDLVDDLIDPILVLLLATFGIPLVAGLVQSARGKKNQTQAIRRTFG